MFLCVLLSIVIIGANARWNSSDVRGLRVVNGRDAYLGEIPYIVSLRYNHEHVCAGSSIDAWHVLTAAHCITTGSNFVYSIQYGVTRISRTGNVINVDIIHVHEGFSSGPTHDIALLQLAEPIPFSAVAQPIALPHQGDMPPFNEWAVAAGWGVSYTGGPVMPNLQLVYLKIYSDELCKRAHFDLVDEFSNVCAGVVAEGKTVCNGDSGGPLVANGKQVGIVSWVFRPCGVNPVPAVYTRVASYINWINAKRSL